LARQEVRTNAWVLASGLGLITPGVKSHGASGIYFLFGVHVVKTVSVTNAREPNQGIVALDVEGVLIPEIWIAVAERTGIEDLKRTTREEPDYDKLMLGRLEILRTHGLTMSLIEEVMSELKPLAGAKEFLDSIRNKYQVILLSDTFEQFARPFMRQLGMPTVFCHRLIIKGDEIADYELRQVNQKQKAVEAFRGLNYRVAAAGDSYNDTTMLAAATKGFLFRAPTNVIAEFPEYPAFTTYQELESAIDAVLGE